MSKLSLFAQTIKHELTHPVDKTPTGLTLELIGTDHDDVYQETIDVMKSLSAKGAKEIIDFGMSLELKIRVAAACIVGWTISAETQSDWDTIFKESVGVENSTYSAESALKLVSMKNASWIRTQIDTAVGDKQRFFSNALTTSLTQ